MASEISLSSLTTFLSWWEISGYLSLFFVGIGVAGEFIHDFIPALRRRCEWWDAWGGKASGLLLIAALAAELVTQVQTNNKSAQIVAALRLKAAVAEERLLIERRTTARERWQMETIARAVLPRQLAPVSGLVAALKGLGPINVAVVDKREPRFFGLQVVQLFQQAKIMGRLIWLPNDNDHWGTNGFFGVEMCVANNRGAKAAEILWRQEHIAGGVVSCRITLPGWEAIPKGEDTLIVGLNDAMWQPQNGQPGEGMDKYGAPVPAPQ